MKTARFLLAVVTALSVLFVSTAQAGYVANDPINKTDPTGMFECDGGLGAGCAGVSARPEPVTFSGPVVTADGSIDPIVAKEVVGHAVSVGQSAADLGSVISLASGVGSLLTIRAPAAVAVSGLDDAARAAGASSTTGASGALLTAEGQIVTGLSTRAASTAGTARAPMQATVKEALDSAPDALKAIPRHGKCCEIDALNRALGSGLTVQGGTSVAVNVTTGAIKAPCPNCTFVLNRLGVNSIKP